MTSFLLVVHVATAIVFIGALTVSASVFPRYATGDAAVAYADSGGHPAAVAMHRITKGYGRLAIIPPIVGSALALLQGRIGELWILSSIALVALGGILLVWRVIPLQAQMLREPTTDPKARRRAALHVGNLNMVWLAVLILMVIRPGGVG